MGTAATLLIVTGVWGEIFFGQKARIAGDKQLAQLEARAAEANQKAQEAALELATFRQSRMLTPEEIGRIAEKLKPYAGTHFIGATAGRDPEFIAYLQSIESALVLANWQALDWPFPNGAYRGKGRTTIGGIVPIDVEIGGAALLALSR